jgi:hypothetical protein
MGLVRYEQMSLDLAKPEPIYIQFFCAVLLTRSVDSKFPGGKTEFLKVHGGVLHEEIICISAMAMNEMNDLLDVFEDSYSLLAGRDLALAEFVHGEVVACPGIIFSHPHTKLFPPWSVRYEPSQVQATA